MSDLSDRNKKFIEIAKVAYDAYREAVDNKSFNGEVLKDFDQLPDKIKIAWIASIFASQKAWITAAFTVGHEYLKEK